MNIDENVAELMAELANKIDEAERKAHDDFRRYQDETRELGDERMRRFHEEVAPMRAMLDRLRKTLADVEATKPPAPTVITKDKLE